MWQSLWRSAQNVANFAIRCMQMRSGNSKLRALYKATPGHRTQSVRCAIFFGPAPQINLQKIIQLEQKKIKSYLPVIKYHTYQFNQRINTLQYIFHHKQTSNENDYHA